MGGRSSVCRDFVNVKTIVGLERFEVGKSRNSYVPFKSCLGKGRCGPVNSIPQANICLNVDARFNWREGAPQGVDPLPTWIMNRSEPKRVILIASNRLKIGQREANG